ncbi:D-serine ammonia-lyase [Histomonas meleagridis]|uniref:D-serine ammonia-lyase n=1 Tax=Histomonas meleagridis TaxID=135588 RepID=UPI00355A6433|nr:D-serine ammonia-lyase [Histomonas meleagridis]KAH0801142.1 D-serine ammonia-lyase [Histomonas meleagridis]
MDPKTLELPIIQKLLKKEEVTWINPKMVNPPEAFENFKLTLQDVLDAEKRLHRFAPLIKKIFPETENTNGIIESPLQEIPNMKNLLNDFWKSNLTGNLYIKMDSNLPIAGSVKARGGIYEVLKHAEDLAFSHGLLQPNDDYTKLSDPSIRQFFSTYSIHVGSTGNLGLSIGIISASLGFQVYVHMSRDAKQWKKDLLRSKGVHVIEYSGDYNEAVLNGRIQSSKDPKSYFIDDENSNDLFLGYSVSCLRLKEQLKSQGLEINKENQLFVYIPCGVGGAPGGISFGLKQEYCEDVHIFLVEPIEACCMLLGITSELYENISVNDIGLSCKTEADGLACAKPSKLVSKLMEKLMSGEFTVDDQKLFVFLKQLFDSENIFIEPSSCAAFIGPTLIQKDENCLQYLERKGISDKMDKATHIVWATGGDLVPSEIREMYYKRGQDLYEKIK